MLIRSILISFAHSHVHSLIHSVSHCISCFLICLGCCDNSFTDGGGVCVDVSEMDDNVEQIKQDLQTFLYHLRLKAEVSVVPLVGFTTVVFILSLNNIFSFSVQTHTADDYKHSMNG